MSAEFWLGFYYGALAVAAAVCAVGVWRADRRIQKWLEERHRVLDQ